MVHKNNSEGKPIHGTDAGIEAFHDWAGGTELKDEHGRPQVMYHGTSHDKDFKDIKVPKKLALDNHLTTGDHIDATLNDHENVRKYAINHDSATKENYHKALCDVHASVRNIAQHKLDGLT